MVSNRLPITIAAAAIAPAPAPAPSAVDQPSADTASSQASSSSSEKKSRHKAKSKSNSNSPGLSNKRSPNNNSNLVNARYKYTPSSGGLVSGISGISTAEYSMTWIGWPGSVNIPLSDRPAVQAHLLSKFGAVPVFLDPQTADLHYNGFSNGILWPLFHYQPGDINYDEQSWEAHKRATIAFADVVSAHVRDGDLVWIHDYHLMLLPEMLRARLDPAKFPNVKIGWFLHIPFPSSEIYRVLPVRKEILMGVLAADLLGFHTYDYARHFLSSCARILGAHTMPNVVEFEGRNVYVGTFPIGIDPDKFHQCLEKDSVRTRIQTLKSSFADLRVIVGVDRLDYIKGVPQKLRAFELFLQTHPEWIERVVLVQIAVPSRQDVEEYQHLRDVVNELVGRINGKFGSLTFMPIHFVHRSVNFEELAAIYAISDVCVVSSTRDGMNLVSSEYIACQQEKHGVLILSEFAGASQSLNGSLIVNPWNLEELACAYHEALTMSEEQKLSNFKKLSRYVNKYTAAHWGSAFVKELMHISQVSATLHIPRANIDEIVQTFKASRKKKVVFLDYDGTLTASNRLPEFAKPSSSLLNILHTLSAIPDVYLYVLSGRSREHMNGWFGDQIGLCAEHGCFYRHPKKFNSSLFENLQSYNQVLRSTAHVGSSSSSINDSANMGTTPMARPSPQVPLSARGKQRRAVLEQVSHQASSPPATVVSAMNASSAAAAPLENTSTPTKSTSTRASRREVASSDGNSGGGSGNGRKEPEEFVRPGASNNSDILFAPQQLRVPKLAGDGWLALVDAIDGSWRDAIRPLFEHYTERTPGSWIEEKEINITWHYMDADPDFGSWQAAELQVNLERVLSHLAVSIVLGNKTLELRPSSIEKLTVARSILKDISSEDRLCANSYAGGSAHPHNVSSHGSHSDCDFFMCVGDGKTDEPVFGFINGIVAAEGENAIKGFTVTVGKKQTEAMYFLDTVKDVELLIRGLAT
ncbi:Trehalose-6-P synthase/phosphatase complex synthase subunit [Entophlyctis sp. JEL0112]|nr:Trehalose-6-P synthase/phosphatase complex synthase subunit [Entophlyctis sp. JEL0112]